MRIPDFDTKKEAIPYTEVVSPSKDNKGTTKPVIDASKQVKQTTDTAVFSSKQSQVPPNVQRIKELQSLIAAKKTELKEKQAHYRKLVLDATPEAHIRGIDAAIVGRQIGEMWGDAEGGAIFAYNQAFGSTDSIQDATQFLLKVVRPLQREIKQYEKELEKLQKK